MKSASGVSYELDDGLKTARELADSITSRLELGRGSVGIMFCDADMDGAAVTGELKRLLGIEVVGMTTLAALDSAGRHESASVLLVLTGDDCEFKAAVSEPLSSGDAKRALADAFLNIGGAVSPRLMFICSPSGMLFSGDRYPDVLSAVMPGVPLIGGVASDDYDYERARVFFSGAEYRDRAVILGMGGNVKPTFALRHVTSRFAERKRRIVQAEGNVVYKVGDETFVKYLESFDLRTDVDDPLLAFTSYPMMLTKEGGDEIPLMRHIFGLDHETGSGSFLGDVPTGTLANICLVSKDDIVAACRESMKSLIDVASRTGDYEYSAIFCISCCGRAMILGAEAGAEGSVISGMMPEGVSLAGAYCLGEICPARYTAGEVSNRFHNCSIAFCML